MNTEIGLKRTEEPSGDFRSWFTNKLLMDMTWPDYFRSLLTPFNIVAAIILSVGLPVLVLRFYYGLYFATHASNEYPWGLYLGWGLFGGVPLSATGFVMATAYYIFGFRRYHPLLRLGVLTGFLGYLFAVIYLLVDLGRPWRIYFPMMIGFGTQSVLFLVAWHVATYLTVQFVEFSPAILEWLKSNRVRKWAVMLTIGMTIAGIILSTLHQSALGAMYLLVPGKLHPLWYSSYLPVFFLTLEHLCGTCHGDRGKHPRGPVPEKSVRQRVSREPAQADPRTGAGRSSGYVCVSRIQGHRHCP